MSVGSILIYTLLGLAALLMLRRLQSLFKGRHSVEDLKSMLDRGALVVDVRTPGEFAGGHIPNSLNIPLDQLMSRSGELDPKRTILLCCASGGRSGMAKGLLEKSGFQDVHNAGPWQRLLIQ